MGDETGEEPRVIQLFSMKEDNQDSFVSPWTAAHVLSGAAAKAIGISFSMNFLLHAVYELKDLTNDEVYNSPLNSIGDQFASMAGHYVATKGQQMWVWAFLAVYAALVYGGHQYG